MTPDQESELRLALQRHAEGFRLECGIGDLPDPDTEQAHEDRIVAMVRDWMDPENALKRAKTC